MRKLSCRGCMSHPRWCHHERGTRHPSPSLQALRAAQARVAEQSFSLSCVQLVPGCVSTNPPFILAALLGADGEESPGFGDRQTWAVSQLSFSGGEAMAADCTWYQIPYLFNWDNTTCLRAGWED